MVHRNKLLASAVALGLLALAPRPASADLIGAGKTVTASYFFGSSASAESENLQTFGSTAPVSLAAPVSYVAGPQDDSTIQVNAAQITITNDEATGITYCNDGTSVGSACTDQIDGFQFLFAGEAITGASIDPATPSTFFPATFGGHVGLDLVNGNDLLIDVTGADPANLDKLVIDLTFGTVTPPPLPEPASLALFGVAVGGIIVAHRRRPRAA